MKIKEAILKVFLILSIPQAIETLIAIVVIMIGVIILLWNNPFFGILFGILLAIAVFAIVAIFVNRKEVKREEEEKKRMLGDLEKGLNIKEAGMDYSIVDKNLPLVVFTIAIEKKIDVKLQPQKILFLLTCDTIPLKTFFWDRSHNIEKVKDYPDIEAPDIDAIGDGKITIAYQCVNVYYNHDYIHRWDLKGRVTFHSRIGDINREIELTFQLDKKKEEKLKNAIKGFQRDYVEGVKSKIIV